VYGFGSARAICRSLFGLFIYISSIPVQGLYTWATLVSVVFGEEARTISIAPCSGWYIYLYHISVTHSRRKQMWNGLFFQTATLHELGLRVQLGHAPGHHCTSREPCHKDFRVIHTNGIHKVNVDFCRCQSVPHHLQLLRLAWWPGTPLVPKTCTTMEALKQFDMLNVQGKLTAFSYYRSLEYLTDNSGLSEPSVRIKSCTQLIFNSKLFFFAGSFTCFYHHGPRVPSY